MLCIFTMDGYIRIYIPSVDEGISLPLPSPFALAEDILRQGVEWVESHKTLGQFAEIAIWAWGPGSRWHYEATPSKIANFGDKLEDVLDVVTGRVFVR